MMSNVNGHNLFEVHEVTNKTAAPINVDDIPPLPEEIYTFSEKQQLTLYQFIYIEMYREYKDEKEHPQDIFKNSLKDSFYAHIARTKRVYLEWITQIAIKKEIPPRKLEITYSGAIMYSILTSLSLAEILTNKITEMKQDTLLDSTAVMDMHNIMCADYPLINLAAKTILQGMKYGLKDLKKLASKNFNQWFKQLMSKLEPPYVT